LGPHGGLAGKNPARQGKNNQYLDTSYKAGKAFAVFLLFFAVFATVGTGVFAQDNGKPLSLNQAVAKTAGDLAKKAPNGSVVAVYCFSIEIENVKPALTKRLIDDTCETVNKETPRIKLAERNTAAAEAVEKELALHQSGRISDETAKSIAKATGADYVITVSIALRETGYHLTMSLTHLEKNEREATVSAGIRKNDSAINFYINKKGFVSLGAKAGAGVNVASLSGDIAGEAENPSAGFEPAVQAAFHFNNLIAAQTGLELSYNKVSYSGRETTGESYSASFESFALLVPLLARLSWRKPGTSLGNFIFAGFAGVGFSIPLGAMKLESNLLGSSEYRFSEPPRYIAGISAGRQLGQGVLFADMRFSGGFAKTAIHDSSGTLALYSKNTLSLSLGYEYELPFSLSRK